MSDRYRVFACRCGAPSCDNWVVEDFYFSEELTGEAALVGVPVLLNASRPQAIGCCEVLNRLAHTNDPDGDNINEMVN